MGKNYLVALENDSTKEFASQAYLKGFLRIYTTYLGLNPDDMIRMHDKYAQGPVISTAAQKSSSETEKPKRRLSLQKFALPAILLLLIIITAGILNRSDAPPKRDQTIPQPVEQKPAQAVQPQLSTARTLPIPSQRPESASPTRERSVEVKAADQNNGQAAPGETARSFIVHMKVTQNGTLTVTIDGTLSQKYELTAGDAIEWKAEKQVALELSNAGGVEVELNGKPLRPLGPAGKPVIIVLDADGVRP